MGLMLTGFIKSAEIVPPALPIVTSLSSSPEKNENLSKSSGCSTWPSGVPSAGVVVSHIVFRFWCGPKIYQASQQLQVKK